MLINQSIITIGAYFIFSQKPHEKGNCVRKKKTEERTRYPIDCYSCKEKRFDLEGRKSSVQTERRGRCTRTLCTG